MFIDEYIDGKLDNYYIDGRLDSYEDLREGVINYLIQEYEFYRLIAEAIETEAFEWGHDDVSNYLSYVDQLAEFTLRIMNIQISIEEIQKIIS